MPNVELMSDNLAMARQYGDRWSKHASASVNHWTALDPDKEQQFRKWVQEKQVPFDPEEKASDYDMRGFWQDMQAGNERAQSSIDPYDGRLHFGDHYKTPLHRTYSNESRGALPTAPKWSEDGRYLVDHQGQTVFDAVAEENRRKQMVGR